MNSGGLSRGEEAPGGGGTGGSQTAGSGGAMSTGDAGEPELRRLPGRSPR